MTGTRRLWITGAIVAALSAAGAPRAAAQSSCTTSSSIRSASARTCTITISTPNASSYTNPKLLSLTVSSTTIDLTVNEAAFVAGETPEAILTLQVQGNRSWVVTASGPAVWTSSGTMAWAAKPVDDLLWSTTSGAAGTPLSVSAATVMSGGATAVVSSTLYWKAALAWETDKPGSYALPVTLTLTTP
ncbi:MAG: hypothetical protein P3B98_02940 [Gemmatimonadota bacterium]|nr:hypothetical protein [Gemmatimonadota bacterium]